MHPGLGGHSPGADAVVRKEGPIPDERAELTEQRRKPTVEPDQQEAVAPPRRLEDLGELFLVECERLLAEDVLAVLERACRQLGVRTVARGDDDGVDIGILDHLELACRHAGKSEVAERGRGRRPRTAADELEASSRLGERRDEHAPRKLPRADQANARGTFGHRSGTARLTRLRRRPRGFIREHQGAARTFRRVAGNPCVCVCRLFDRHHVGDQWPDIE